MAPKKKKVKDLYFGFSSVKLNCVLSYLFFPSDGLKMLQKPDEIHFIVLNQAEAVPIPLAIIFENSWKKEIPEDGKRTNIVPILLKKERYIYTHAINEINLGKRPGNYDPVPKLCA